MGAKCLSLVLVAVTGSAAFSCGSNSEVAASGARGEGDVRAGDGGPDAAASGPNAPGAEAPAVDGAQFVIEVQLASELDPRAPTTVGVVTWSFHGGEVRSAQIEFGLDPAYGMVAPVDLAEPGFRTLLLGMKPERAYHFRVAVQTASGFVASDDHVVKTGAATDLVELGAFRVLNEEGRSRGYIVTSYWQGPSAAVPFILDADGEVVWWFESSSTGIARASLSADAQNLWLAVASNSGGPLERVRMDGLDSQVYAETVASHDITPVEGPVMAYLDYGEDDCDSIREIEPGGDSVEVFDSESVLPGGRLAQDGCHANALRYWPAADLYTLSDLHTDIFGIRRQGELGWRWSELVRGGNDAWGGAQHGHHWLDGGLLLFANRLGEGSGVVEYGADGQERFRHEGARLSANLGDVQRLPGGNTLITYSNASLIEEIDASGSVLLEIDGGGYAFGYAAWRATLYGPPADVED